MLDSYYDYIFLHMMIELNNDFIYNVLNTIYVNCVSIWHTRYHCWNCSCSLLNAFLSCFWHAYGKIAQGARYARAYRNLPFLQSDGECGRETFVRISDISVWIRGAGWKFPRSKIWRENLKIWRKFLRQILRQTKKRKLCYQRMRGPHFPKLWHPRCHKHWRDEA